MIRGFRLTLAIAITVTVLSFVLMPAFADSVTIDEAKKTPGIYIKDGDQFTLIESQLKERGAYSHKDWLFPMLDFNSGSFVTGQYSALILDPSTEIVQIQNNAQIVLIGFESVNIDKATDSGYAIPYEVSLDSDGYHLRGYFGTGFGERIFETLDGFATGYQKNPKFPTIDVSPIMLFTHQNFSLMRNQVGILKGYNENYQFTFGRFIGTEFEETTIEANKRFFAFQIRDGVHYYPGRLDVSLERTMNGYFVVHLPQNTVGNYILSPTEANSSAGFENCSVVEFINPTKTTSMLTSSSADGITVTVDDMTLIFDVPPQIINGRTMVPLRAIFEEMGATIDYDSSTQTVTATKDNTVIVLTIGNTSPTVNGQVVTIDQPGILMDGRTLAPLRFVAEAFGGSVDWDGVNQIATITNQQAPAFITIGGQRYSTSLVSLDLGGLGLRNEDIEPLKYMSNLTTLDIRYNAISNLTSLSGLTNMSSLLLTGNLVSSIEPLASLVNLKELELSQNQISNIEPLSGLSNLNILGLSGGQIRDITPLSNLSKITTLDISYNLISDISPLANLRNLSVLHMSMNQISDLRPLSGFTNMMLLSLSGNQVVDISPLSGMSFPDDDSGMTGLGLSENPITDWSPVEHIANVGGRP